jgi:hypothetical protein
VSLTKLESIDVVQGILGRMLGYGTILVVGTESIKEPRMGTVAPGGFSANNHHRSELGGYLTHVS